MASNLKSSITSPISRALLASPKALSASPYRFLPSRKHSSFTIKAVQPEK
ncbi:photosystem I reaction center subunit XI, chloroplastic-like protein, partial [Corchorus capsularis]